MTKTLYILDGHYQIHRAFHAPLGDLRTRGGQLTSPSGEPTQATYIFCRILFNLIRECKPDYVAVAFDVSDETVFRRDLDPNYKANREASPEPLQVQAERIAQIVSALGIPILQVPGFEADDVIATVVERLKDTDVQVYMVSRDKDLEQLISERAVLYDAHQSKVIDAARLVEKKGYTPQQALEIQTLTGDSTDNIPGITGVGPKTALKLIEKYGAAEAVIAHADELTPKQAQNVKAFAAQLPLTRQLVTLRRDTPIEFDLAACCTDRLNPGAVAPIFEELGFKRLRELLAGLGPDAEVPEEPPAVAASSERGQYELIDTEARLAEFAAQLRQQRAFALDTETTSLRPVDAALVGLSFAWEAGKAYYLPVRSALGKVLPVEAVLAQLKPILANEATTKIGQNLKYDLLVLKQTGIEVRGPMFDTMIAAFLIDPLRGSLSLDNLAKTLFEYEKIPTSALIGKGKNQITMDQVDPREVCEYAGEDADFTWRLYELFEPQLAGGPFETLFRNTEMPLVEVLVQMEHNGVALDTAVLRKLGEQMGDRMIELTRIVHKEADHEFNLDSPKQLANVLFDELCLPVIRKTKTGRSTDAETLEALARRTECPIPELVLEYRELAKLKGTYLDTLPRMISPRTGRVHASFNQTIAITGRLSSSDPNLQNIPVRTELGRQIRKAFVAPGPDCVLLVADYSQVELRLLAHFCRDGTLLDAFRSGQDIHRVVAAQVNGVGLDEVTAEQRSAAKAVNFGIIYGQTPFGLARALNIGVDEAKSFIDAYFARYPGIRIFTKRCVAQAKEQGYAETILGRRRPIPELHSRNGQQVALGERLAVNTVVQGSAADLIKRAMLEIHRAERAGEHAARMLLQVHDELVFEVRASEVETAAKLVRAKMVNALELDVPLTVDIAWGANWYEGK